MRLGREHQPVEVGCDRGGRARDGVDAVAELAAIRGRIWVGQRAVGRRARRDRDRLGRAAGLTSVIVTWANGLIVASSVVGWFARAPAMTEDTATGVIMIMPLPLFSPAMSTWLVPPSNEPPPPPLPATPRPPAPAPPL